MRESQFGTVVWVCDLFLTYRRRSPLFSTTIYLIWLDLIFFFFLWLVVFLFRLLLLLFFRFFFSWLTRFFCSFPYKFGLVMLLTKRSTVLNTNVLWLMWGGISFILTWCVHMYFWASIQLIIIRFLYNCFSRRRFFLELRIYKVFQVNSVWKENWLRLIETWPRNCFAYYIW